jgi:hypothetical protein
VLEEAADRDVPRRSQHAARNMRLLDRLVANNAVSEELLKKLLDSRHPGFSSHVSEP